MKIPAGRSSDFRDQDNGHHKLRLEGRIRLERAIYKGNKVSTKKNDKRIKGGRNPGNAAARGNNQESVTVLFCSAGHIATKTIRSAGSGGVEIKPYDAGTLFSAVVLPVDGIEVLSAVLSHLERNPTALIIRGAPIAEPINGVYRRLLTQFATPAEGRHWVLIDFDKLTVPDSLRLTEDQRAVMEHLVSKLPEEFHDASYHYQLSSSAGFRGPNVVSAHIWFWLDEPCPDAELKRWGKAVNESADYKMIDLSLFNGVQQHYNAVPVFDGVPDPFPERSGLVRKTNATVKLRLPEAEIPQAATGSGFGMAPAIGFEGFLAAIGDHPGGDGFHQPIISAIASYVSEHGRVNVDKEQLFEVVRDRVRAADATKHDAGYIRHMASREHIMPAIEGALTKYGDRPTAHRRMRVIHGIAPAARGAALGGSEAHKQLSEALRGIIGGSRS